MKSHDIAGVSCAPDRLTVEWADGVRSEFASLWLRDNRPEDRDLHSGQRLIDVMDLPENPRLRSATLEDGAVRVEWQAEPRAAKFSSRVAGRPCSRPPAAAPGAAGAHLAGGGRDGCAPGFRLGERRRHWASMPRCGWSGSPRCCSRAWPS